MTERTNWKARAEALAKEVDAVRNDRHDHDLYLEREKTRLIAERDMWKVQAVALGKALHIVLRDINSDPTS